MDRNHLTTRDWARHWRAHPEDTMTTPAQPDPAAQLRAAAQELRAPSLPGLTPYIALMHPDFGDALAKMLDDSALQLDRASALFGDLDAWAFDRPALAVARALLGGQP